MPTLLLAASVDAAIAVVLVYVGLHVLRRPTSSAARAAAVGFAAWWCGLGFTVLANAAREAAAGFGVHEAPVVIAVVNATQYVYVAALTAAVWGLLYYLVYLYTGNRRWLAPISAFYAVYGLVALALVARMRPAGVTPGKWFAGMAYESPEAGGALLVVMVLLLLLPQIVAAIAYLRVKRRLDDPLARYRVTIVSWSLILWLGLSLVAPFVQLGRFEWWQAGGRLVGLAAAIAILLAYSPPRAIRERLEGGARA